MIFFYAGLAVKGVPKDMLLKKQHGVILDRVGKCGSKTFFINPGFKSNLDCAQFSGKAFNQIRRRKIAFKMIKNIAFGLRTYV